jgi:hypothetical protein
MTILWGVAEVDNPSCHPNLFGGHYSNKSSSPGRISGAVIDVAGARNVQVSQMAALVVYVPI